MEKMFNKFTEQYSLFKTLKFEVQPVGKTRENFDMAEILRKDYQRAEDYKKMKIIIDNLHRDIISRVLNNPDIEPQIWVDLHDAYNELQKAQKHLNQSKKTDTEEVIVSAREQLRAKEEEYEKLQKNARKQIRSLFTQQPEFINNNLFKEKLLSQILPKFITNEDELRLLDTFQGFSGYFKGYNEARKNVYSDKDISTSITHRIVHINFPKFIANMQRYQEVQNKYPEILVDLKSEADSVFSLQYFNSVLAQSGIDNYNAIMGRFNQSLNLYCQQHPEHVSVKRKYQMNKLYKQILSLSDKTYIDKFEDSVQATDAFKAFCEQLESNQTLLRIKQLFNDLYKYELAYVYVNKPSQYSHYVYGNSSELEEIQRVEAAKKIVKMTKAKSQDIEKYINSKFFSLDEILSLPESEDTPAKKISDIINEKYENILSAQKELPDGDIIQNHIAVKKYLDSIQDLIRFLKLFAAPESYVCDMEFYNQYNESMEVLNNVTDLFNKIRNLVTQKPYSTDKLKLTFNFPTLAAGWDENRNLANGTMLFQKGDDYYLGIMNNTDKIIINEDTPCDKEGENYTKIFYKCVSDPTQQLAHMFLPHKANREDYDFSKSRYPKNPTNKFLRDYTEGRYKVDLEFCHEVIDYFKERIFNYPGWEVFNFKFSDTASYESISQFYEEMRQQSYIIEPRQKISEKYINESIDNGTLYLFRIYNKDFSDSSTGLKNLHTLYWHALFEPNTSLQLNGEAELFYRAKSIDDPVIHKKGSILINKYDKDEELISTEEYQKINQHLNYDKPYNGDLSKIITRPAPHDIVKDKRYTEDKYFFHVPININYRQPKTKNINQEVLKILKNNPDVKIIGIDRGERNLLYVSLINQNGEIEYQKSLNLINKHNYHNKLEQKYKERQTARQNWTPINSIKELKAGYLSVAVHEIVTMMIDNNASIVMEQLNPNFTKTRGKFEHQIYQKFEKMLTDKLNYLVFKKYEKTNPGGVLNGYQLTGEFNDKARQNGFIFYVPAAYTSAIDPTTGFVRLIKINPDNLMSFDKIRYNPSGDYFEFHIDYRKFPTSRMDHQNKWIICTKGDKRYFYSRKSQEVTCVNVTEEIKTLLNKQEISYQDGKDWKVKIGKQNKTFKNTLSYLINLTMNMRYSNRDTGEDFILSPVKNKNGEFFMSCSENDNLPKKLPTDGDANGAYHIALKGLQLISGITKNYRLPDITTADWFKYAQQRHQEE